MFISVPAKNTTAISSPRSPAVCPMAQMAAAVRAKPVAMTQLALKRSIS